MEFKGLKGDTGRKWAGFHSGAAEIESARIGLILGGKEKLVDRLPISGVVNEDSFMPAETARVVLRGNIVLLGQMGVSDEIKGSEQFSQVSEFVRSGVASLLEASEVTDQVR